MLELIKLQKLANNNRLPHAILLNANQQTALDLAKNFSKWLLCGNLDKNHHNNYSKNINNCSCSSCKLFVVENHPDYCVIDLGKDEEIKIEHIRSANQFILSNVYLSQTKILLINHIHNINLQAVNAFLKNLEEPSLNFKILILLITNNPKVLPNTILSRVIKINLFNLDNNNLDKEFELILLQDLYKVWSNGNFTPYQLVTKWQTFDKAKLVYCLWFIISKLIKSPKEQLLLDLSEKISPKVLWLLLDSLNYVNKSIILGDPINWQLFLYNFIMTKFTGENIYVNRTTTRS